MKRARPRRIRPWWVAVVFLVLLAAAAMEWSAERRAAMPAAPALSSPSLSAAPARRETRPTLDPARFVGKARLAHQVAREIPDTLDQLYCYCECDKHAGHTSLLSCFTDGHAAT